MLGMAEPVRIQGTPCHFLSELDCASSLLQLLCLLHTQYGHGYTLTDPDIARTVLVIFWMIAEPIRLAAGWYGNLQENVSATTLLYPFQRCQGYNDLVFVFLQLNIVGRQMLHTRQ